jgi:hypothetical protein
VASKSRIQRITELGRSFARWWISARSWLLGRWHSKTSLKKREKEISADKASAHITLRDQQQRQRVETAKLHCPRFPFMLWSSGLWYGVIWYRLVMSCVRGGQIAARCGPPRQSEKSALN